MSYPLESQVLNGVVFGASDELTGNLLLPAASDVRDGIGFGAEGTEHEGNLVVPAAFDLRLDAVAGSNGTEVIGDMVIPKVRDVRGMIAFDSPGLGKVGGLASPSFGDVRSGVWFGYRGEFAGVLLAPGHCSDLRLTNLATLPVGLDSGATRMHKDFDNNLYVFDQVSWKLGIREYETSYVTIIATIAGILSPDGIVLDFCIDTNDNLWLVVQDRSVTPGPSHVYYSPLSDLVNFTEVTLPVLDSGVHKIWCIECSDMGNIIMAGEEMLIDSAIVYGFVYVEYLDMVTPCEGSFAPSDIIFSAKRGGDGNVYVATVSEGLCEMAIVSPGNTAFEPIELPNSIPACMMGVSMSNTIFLLAYLQDSIAEMDKGRATQSGIGLTFMEVESDSHGDLFALTQTDLYTIAIQGYCPIANEVKHDVIYAPASEAEERIGTLASGGISRGRITNGTL